MRKVIFVLLVVASFSILIEGCNKQNVAPGNKRFTTVGYTNKGIPIVQDSNGGGTCPCEAGNPCYPDCAK